MYHFGPSSSSSSLLAMVSKPRSVSFWKKWIINEPHFYQWVCFVGKFFAYDPPQVTHRLQGKASPWSLPTCISLFTIVLVQRWGQSNRTRLLFLPKPEIGPLRCANHVTDVLATWRRLCANRQNQHRLDLSLSWTVPSFPRSFLRPSHATATWRALDPGDWISICHAVVMGTGGGTEQCCEDDARPPSSCGFIGVFEFSPKRCKMCKVEMFEARHL